MTPKSILFRGRVLLICVFLIATQFVAAVADAQMRQVYKDEFKPDNEIRGISFYSPSAGFVAFDDWIGYTTDSGRTFTQKPIAWGNVDYDGYPVNLTFGFDPKGIKAFDQNNIIVCGHYGLENTILRSTDGGNTFKVVFHKGYNPNITSEGITDVQFVNNSIGYAVDEDLILKTTNGGQTWSLIRADAGSWFSRINIIDNSNLFVYSTEGNGKILKSTNAGSSWQPVTLPGNSLHSAYFLTAAKGWVSMGDEGIYQTLNAGASWTRQNHPAVPFTSDRMIFTNDNTGYSLGGIFGICKTTDAGKIWEPLPRDSDISDVHYNELFFYNSDQLWAGGSYSFLELSTNAGGTPLPRAFFTIDTSGLFNTGMVNLTNHSKTGHTFKWFKNDTLIGTGYHASINRGAFSYPLKDTFMLVATNGAHTDTAILYQDYHEPVYIADFSPVMAASLATVTITGAHFSGASAVSFGGTPAASFTVVNDNTITAIVGGGATGNVTVVTPGRSTATLPGFSFLPRPVITSFSPTAATAGSVITISGINFEGIKAVRIGGKPATSYTVVSLTTITAVVPSGGSGSVEVIGNAGNGELAGFVAIPTLLSFTPTKGTNGSLLKIKGTSLTDVTDIKLGGTPVRSFTILSADSISAIVGEGSSGNLELTSIGGNVSLPGFTYNNPPVITSFAPLSGPIGTTITITGTNFRPAAGENIVLFGTLRATVTAASTTSLTVTVPAGATAHQISVTANGLTAFSSRTFQSTFPGGGAITPASFIKTNITTEGPGVWRDYIEKTVADIDGDGKEDVLITDGWMAGMADVLRNTSTGNTFTWTPYLKVADLAASFTFADLDGDGKADYLVASNGVQFNRNTCTPGNISMENWSRDYSLSTSESRIFQNIAVNDVDKDGKPDVAVACLQGMYVFRNIGEPGLINFEPVALPYGGYDLTMADIDLDGRPDIIQFNPATGSITIYKNTSTKGNISFTPALTLPATTPFALVTGDVDGDGLPDIIAGSQDGNKIEVFRNTTAGSTIAFADPKQYAMPGITYDVALADLDGNGKPDIIASTDTYHFITFTNRSTAGNINFEPAVNHSTNPYANYRGYRFRISIGDLNADGRPDPLIIDKSQQARLCLYTNETVAKPYIREFTPTNASKDALVTIKGRNFTGVTAVNFGGVAAAAFNIVNDTTIEATVGTGATGTLSVTNQFGTTEMDGFVFGAIPAITSFSPAAGPVGSQVVLTGSGFDPVPANNIVFFGGVITTVVAATSTSLIVKVPAGAAPDWISVTTNSRTAYAGKHFVVTFPGNQAGFSDSSFVNTQVTLPGAPIAFADFDRDGKNDLLSIHSDLGVFVNRNTSTIGALSFGVPIDAAMGQGAVAAATGDLDGDGRIDVVAASATTNTFQAFRNITTAAGISFAPGITFKAVDQLQAGNGIAIGDVDGDGRPDVVFTSANARRFTVLKNLSTPGRISFADPLQYGFNGTPWGVTCEDLDNDGRAEVLMPGSSFIGGSDEVIVFQNTGTSGTIVMTQASGAGINGGMIKYPAYGDLDGDGRTDISIGSYQIGGIAISQNIATGSSFSFLRKIDMYLPESRGVIVGVGDLDGDGRPDVMASTENLGTLLYKNISASGNIILKEKVNISYSNFMYRSLFVDVDGDGALDMINGSATVALNKMAVRTVDVELCQEADTTLLAGLTAAAYQWQQDAGNGFLNIQDNSNFSGTTSDRLQLKDIPASWSGYKYRCLDNNLQPGRIYKLNISNADVLPSVTIATLRDTICAGANITFEATAINGGGTPTWQWQVNGIAAGQNTSTFGTNTLNDGDEVKVVMTSNAACASMPTAVSNIIPVTVKAILDASVTIKATPDNGCSDGKLTFTATPVNGGLTPVYLWIVNTWPDGENRDTFNADYLKNGDTVKVLMDIGSGNGCSSVSRVFSNVITVGGSAPGDPKIPVTPSVIITASSTNVCTGGTVTFTATPKDGGTAPAYQWQVNGVNVGQNSNTFTSSTLTAGDAVRVFITGNAPCTVGPAVVSNTITLTGGAPVTPSVSITASDASFCAGTAVTYTAASVNGGSTPAYQWQVNGVNVGQNTNTFTTTALNDGDKVSVSLISSASCSTLPSVTSNTITATVSPMIAPVVTVTASATSICPGTEVIFTATTSAGITNPSYFWFVNDMGASGNGNTFSSSTLADGDRVHATMFTGQSCVTDMLTKSNVVPISSNSSLTASVSITASATTFCSGTNVSFTATPVNGGSAPVYQWQVNGVNEGQNSNTFSSNSLSNADVVKVIMTSNAGCVSSPTATSNGIPVTVTSGVTPSVSITASAATICTGAPVTFTANPVNGGSAPTYQWQVNGVNAGQNASTFATNTLTNGAIVKVILTSNASCAPGASATSAITVAVNTFVTPVVVLSGNTTVDQTSSTLIIAATLNGGSSPVYQWQDSTAAHGWQDIPAATGFSINYAPAQTGDKLKVRLLSSLPCAVASTVFSAPISFVVNGLTGGRVAPNPVQSMLHIDQLQLSDNWETVEIASVSGGNKLIVRSVANQTSVDIPVSQLSKGMYVAVLRSKSGATRQIKFMKQ